VMYWGMTGIMVSLLFVAPCAGRERMLTQLTCPSMLRGWRLSTLRAAWGYPEDDTCGAGEWICLGTDRPSISRHPRLSIERHNERSPSKSPRGADGLSHRFSCNRDPRNGNGLVVGANEYSAN
jgi:hypothetical protein